MRQAAHLLPWSSAGMQTGQMRRELRVQRSSVHAIIYDSHGACREKSKAPTAEYVLCTVPWYSSRERHSAPQ
ncbi:unnamed protein product [Arctogadus glacialis]